MQKPSGNDWVLFAVLALTVIAWVVVPIVRSAMKAEPVYTGKMKLK